MPLDPVLVSDTRLWLVKAANDLRAAEIDLGAEPALVVLALLRFSFSDVLGKFKAG